MPFTKRNPRKRPVFKLGAVDDQEKFKPLPAPTGEYPYRLNIEKVLPYIGQQKIVFHMAGDTGSLRLFDIQRGVAHEMGRQYESLPLSDRPQFFFHLGDVVYNFGQAAEYYHQFFDPYKHYPGPIFAIPGNHDGDIDPFDPEQPESLQAFKAVFCGKTAETIPFAGDALRKSNIQPNVYWTLQTPLADIIGLYSNAPRFGTIMPEQREWFINELKASAAQPVKKALIVCLHHSAYSADMNHGSSLHMQLFLDEAFEESGVRPDIVFSGHVHNYQRFEKTYPDGKVIPFIVGGAGGYAELHPIAQPGDPMFPDESRLLDDVVLQNYCDDQHGFIKISLTKTGEGILLDGEFYAVPDDGGIDAEVKLWDCFSIEIK